MAQYQGMMVRLEHPARPDDDASASAELPACRWNQFHDYVPLVPHGEVLRGVGTERPTLQDEAVWPSVAIGWSTEVVNPEFEVQVPRSM